jgi:peptidoglycan/LPS O-acetylase OafA/YrhL
MPEPLRDTGAGGSVDDAVAPPPHHPRFPAVDGLRAVAVVCVVLVHCAEFSGAFSGSLGGRLLAHLNLGVTIFFVISGFLLYRPFIAHRLNGPAAPAVADYAKRRVLRLYPAWWLVVTVLLLVPGLPSVDYQHVWPMYLMLHTLPVSSGELCSTDVAGCGLAQTWSLGAEVTFYAALPLLAIGLDRITRGLAPRVWCASQLAALAVLSAVSLLVQYTVIAPAPDWFGWSVLGTIFWFGLGMGLAVVSVTVAGTPAEARLQRHGRAAGGWACWGLAGAVYVGLALWLAPTPFLLGTGRQFVVTLGFGLIALLALMPAVFGRPRTGPQRVLMWRPVAWVGLISYGIFLWHYAVILELSPRAPFRGSFGLLLLVTAALTTAIAAVSYYLVERPAMRLKYRSLADLGRVAAARRRSPGPSPPI